MNDLSMLTADRRLMTFQCWPVQETDDLSMLTAEMVTKTHHCWQLRELMTFQCWQLRGWWRRRELSASPHSSSSCTSPHSSHSCQPRMWIHLLFSVFFNSFELFLTRIVWHQGYAEREIRDQLLIFAYFRWWLEIQDQYYSRQWCMSADRIPIFR